MRAYFYAAALACAGLSGLVPTQAAAQPSPYGQERSYGGSQTATGDAWRNENDFDYNRRHWVGRDGERSRGEREGEGERRDWNQGGRDGRGRNGPGQAWRQDDRHRHRHDHRDERRSDED